MCACVVLLGVCGGQLLLHPHFPHPRTSWLLWSLCLPCSDWAIQLIELVFPSKRPHPLVCVFLFVCVYVCPARYLQSFPPPPPPYPPSHPSRSDHFKNKGAFITFTKALKPAFTTFVAVVCGVYFKVLE